MEFVLSSFAHLDPDAPLHSSRQNRSWQSCQGESFVGEQQCSCLATDSEKCWGVNVDWGILQCSYGSVISVVTLLGGEALLQSQTSPKLKQVFVSDGHGFSSILLTLIPENTLHFTLCISLLITNIPITSCYHHRASQRCSNSTSNDSFWDIFLITKPWLIFLQHFVLIVPWSVSLGMFSNKLRVLPGTGLFLLRSQDTLSHTGQIHSTNYVTFVRNWTWTKLEPSHRHGVNTYALTKCTFFINFAKDICLSISAAAYMFTVPV